MKGTLRTFVPVPDAAGGRDLRDVAATALGPPLSSDPRKAGAVRQVSADKMRSSFRAGHAQKRLRKKKTKQGMCQCSMLAAGT